MTIEDADVTATGADGAASLGTGTDMIAISALRTGDGLSVTEAQRVAYIYEAGLNRMADEPGVNFWIDSREVGLSEEGLAAAFYNSVEFEASAGGPEEDLSDMALVELLYMNVLDRAGEDAGVTFWTGALAGGLSRERLLIEFADSGENVEGSPEVMTLTEVEPGVWAFA